MKEKIIKHFIQSGVNIISLDKLKEYINFCLTKNVNNKILGETSHHHILPNKLFPEYSDLVKFQWNGVHLKHADHYYAHWLITESLDSSSMLYAFCAMHFKDFKLKRIKEEDLLHKNIIEEKMKLRNLLVTENNLKRHKDGTLFGGYKYCRIKSKDKRNKTLEANPHIIENANKKHSETINNEEWKKTTGVEQVLKRKETISKIDYYEEQRVGRFLDSYKNYQMTDEYKQNKFKRDVNQSKLNNIIVYNKDNEVMYCVPYLFGRFCRDNGMPEYSLCNTITSCKPLYGTKYLLEKAKQKGYDKYEGWYAIQYSPEKV